MAESPETGHEYSTARPPGWGKNYVLERLQGGQTIRQIAKGVAAQCGTQTDTIRKEIWRWRASDKQFEALVMESEGRKDTRLARVNRVEPERVEAAVLAFVESGGDYNEAAKAAGLSPGQLYAYLHKDVDQNLKDAMEDARRVVGGHMVGIAFDSVGEIKDPFRRTVAALKVGAAFDPRIGGRHDRLDVVHSGSIGHRLEAAEVQKLQARLAHVQTSAKQLQAGDVIEGEVVGG